MEMVRVYHPALERTVEVPDMSVQTLLMSGWQRASTEEATQVIKDLETRLEIEKKAFPGEEKTEEVTSSESTEEKPKASVAKAKRVTKDDE